MFKSDTELAFLFDQYFTSSFQSKKYSNKHNKHRRLLIVPCSCPFFSGRMLHWLFSISNQDTWGLVLVRFAMWKWNCPNWSDIKVRWNYQDRRIITFNSRKHSTNARQQSSKVLYAVERGFFRLTPHQNPFIFLLAVPKLNLDVLFPHLS